MKRGLLAAALALACACRHEPPRAAPEESTQIMRSVHMIESLGGRRIWEIEADSATVAESTEIVDMDHPNLAIQKEGEGTTHIKALKGRFDTKNHDMVFTGDVVAYSEKEDSTLYTQILTYASTNDRIWTHEPVRIENENGTIRGRNLVAKSDMSNMVLERNEGVLK